VIVRDQPVAHDDVALRVGSDVLLVSDHDDRDSALVELLKNRHNLDAGAAVEISGWFIGEQHLGIVDQGAGNCDALLLTTGKLARMMIFAAAEPD